MRRTKNLKLPNGFGSIQFLGENRRYPYAVRKTIGWDENGRQIKKYIGYAETWNKAYQLLLEYNNMPYDLNYKNLTIEDIYNKLKIKLASDCEKGKLSNSSYNSLISTWNQNLSKISNVNIFDIKRKDIQKLIDNSNLKYTGRNYIKNLFNKIINYANDELELNINTNNFKLDIGEKEKSNIHKPFTLKEIEIINSFSDINKIAKMIIIYLYTGLRPSELLQIKISNVFLEENYMIGGIKTKAGKNRIIPIHSYIKKYIEYFYDTNNEYLITNDVTKKHITYDMYKNQFAKFMNELKMKHKPHDTRHTFATRCEELGINDVNIKILMGHSLANDVTNDVYIHKNVERLKKEIEKINY